MAKHTNRMTLKCAFCKSHFTALVGERFNASVRHIESCEKAMRRVDQWTSKPERRAGVIQSVADSYITGREIIGHFKAEIKCDARCQGAHGHSCECSCGGANHGVGIAA